ncbi:spermidine/putrescine ABC transporter substrate-binding protein [Hwanghaeella grinnelliae]|uniref:Spermidine/putrescine ABC transporter substrate-binding protein n=1 Tax=Hwanghaeella grinnelliae TaxID=2500179 RepID=A0A3S2VQV4_9PROT|nr:spermidine/putrescine ABC transporter substrate-binding protein [Hwanghaeella grinnelliae]RVU38191.1 spermidine/putrescine ABC transporter substrate-binding protein [Hwanghaeella grinnelliae]
MSKKENRGRSQQPSRRQVLKYSAAAALATPFISRAWANTVEINMLAWYGHGEPDMVGAFEEANNVKFKPKYYAGGDNMLGLIAQSPPGTYDIILSDGEFVQQLNAAGYIEPLDAGDYPFDDMLYEDFTKFPGHWDGDTLYSMMLRFGHLGVSYNKNAISEEEAMSYSCFWKPEIKGKVGHFDWHLPSLGMMSLYNGNGAGLWDLDDAKWEKVQETTLSLRPQVGGFFDYGGTFNSLKNGEMQAMVGIGDWITGVLEKDGAPVASVVPKEGGIQWTESYCIGKGTEKADIVKKFIQYMLSPEGQVKSAQMAAYPGFCITKGGRALLNEVDPKEAKRTGQVDGMANDPITLIKEGRIHYRDIPVQQSLEDWNDFWSEYKNA